MMKIALALAATLTVATLTAGLPMKEVDPRSLEPNDSTSWTYIPGLCETGQYTNNCPGQYAICNWERAQTTSEICCCEHPSFFGGNFDVSPAWSSPITSITTQTSVNCGPVSGVGTPTMHVHCGAGGSSGMRGWWTVHTTAGNTTATTTNETTINPSDAPGRHTADYTTLPVTEIDINTTAINTAVEASIKKDNALKLSTAPRHELVLPITQIGNATSLGTQPQPQPSQPLGDSCSCSTLKGIECAALIAACTPVCAGTLGAGCFSCVAGLADGCCACASDLFNFDCSHCN